jgi:hypothetical protein
MTRNGFRTRLIAISSAAILIIMGSAIAKIRCYEAIYLFFKDMAPYLLLAIVPYITHVFQRRAKFVELLQDEWRRINTIKQDMISYCQRGVNDTNQFIEIYGRLSVAIDNMRVVFCNVGESKEYIGLYPYETLHDFRRQLEAIDPRKKQVSVEDMRVASKNIVSSFQAFRDVFLIELRPVQPDFPVISKTMNRLRKKGVDPRQEITILRKQRKMRAYFKFEA